MSYQVLARKWRPRTFSTLVGQEHVVKALIHALRQQRLHHAYLFTGTRGVGKTTMARILAKCLNCDVGITDTPCGVCDACREIDTGRFVDMLEIDAATNTKVDEMRLLLENAIYAPTKGRFKIYVIDEVHMLSNSAFNAMLKTLEEPPEHVKFILATTDPQKIPVTVLSRCLQLNLKPMPKQAIVEHLTHILQTEDVAFETLALQLLAQDAKGSMRDALSLLDQSIAHGAGTLSANSVAAMLGVADTTTVLGIFFRLCSGELHALLEQASNFACNGISPRVVLGEMASLLVNLQIFQLTNSLQYEQQELVEKLPELASLLSAEEVQLWYQIVVQGIKEVQSLPDEYAGFLMILLRMAAFIQEPTKPQKSLVSVARHQLKGLQPTVGLENQHVGKKEENLHYSDISSQSSPSVEQSIIESRPANDGLHLGGENANWSMIIESLQLSGMAKSLVQHCELLQIDAVLCVLRLDHKFKHLLVGSTEERVLQALRQCYGNTIKLKIVQGDVTGVTPVQLVEQKKAADLDQATSAIQQDSFVLSMTKEFDAHLTEVLPIDSTLN